MDIVGVFQIVDSSILLQMSPEGFGSKSIHRIVLAPELIHFIEIPGTNFVICLEPEVAFGFHKFHQIVAFRYGCCHILLCLGAEGEFIIVTDQPLQSFQRPEEDSFCFTAELFCQKGIVLPVRIPLLDRQDDLPPEETNASVMEGLEGAVAESQEPYPEISLVALLALLFQVHGYFRRNDSLDIVGLVQRFHLHIIVHHGQYMLQICPGKGACFHLGKRPGFHIAAQQCPENYADPGLSFPTSSGKKQHLLPLGGWNEAVTHKFLQGHNIRRVQQLIHKFQPLLGCRCIRIVSYRQTVPTKDFFF